MIYLIEDRPERQRQFLNGFELPADKIQIVSDIDFKGSTDELIDTLKTKLPNPRAVLCHRGHVSLREEFSSTDTIQKYYDDQGISLVYFSGNITNANYIKKANSITANINSRIFYNNLKSFLNGIHDVRVLCFGSKYLLNEFMMFSNAVASHLHQLPNSDELKADTRGYLLEIMKTYAANIDELTEIYSKVEILFKKSNASVGQIRDQLRRAILQVNLIEYE